MGRSFTYNSRMAEPSPKLQFVRALCATLVGLMLALVPCMLLAAFFARAYLIWVMGFFVTGLLLVRVAYHVWPCPRCSKPFFRGGTWAGPNMFTRRCMHCGLSETEDAPPSITRANKSS
jgi:hypothetical protein